MHNNNDRHLEGLGPVLITGHCVARVRERMPCLAYLDDSELHDVLQLHLEIAASTDMVFPNPSRTDQSLYVVNFNGAALFVVVSHGTPRRAVTVLVPSRNARGRHAHIKRAARERKTATTA